MYRESVVCFREDSNFHKINLLSNAFTIFGSLGAGCERDGDRYNHLGRDHILIDVFIVFKEMFFLLGGPGGAAPDGDNADLMVHRLCRFAMKTINRIEI